MSKELPLQIGITGGIGTGKSTVCKIFSVLGIPIYDADSRAKWLMDHDLEIKRGVTKLFGEEAYSTEGLNKKWIADKAFHQKELLEKLNAIVHPAVGKDYKQWVEEHSSASYLIKEAALMFESGSYQKMDKIILVTAPLKLRIDRVSLRDTHRSLADIEAIISKQMPEEEKKTKSDFIIQNDEKKLLIPQVLALHAKLSTTLMK